MTSSKCEDTLKLLVKAIKWTFRDCSNHFEITTLSNFTCTSTMKCELRGTYRRIGAAAKCHDNGGENIEGCM